MDISGRPSHLLRLEKRMCRETSPEKITAWKPQLWTDRQGRTWESRREMRRHAGCCPKPGLGREHCLRNGAGKKADVVHSSASVQGEAERAIRGCWVTDKKEKPVSGEKLQSPEHMCLSPQAKC